MPHSHRSSLHPQSSLGGTRLQNKYVGRDSAAPGQGGLGPLPNTHHPGNPAGTCPQLNFMPMATARR